MQGLERNILPILIDLATMARPHILDEIILNGEPIVANFHNFLSQYGSTSIGSKQALMHLFHQMASLNGIYASKQGFIAVPLIQDFPTKEKLAHHGPNEYILTTYNPRQVFTILHVSLDIVVP